MSLFSGMLRGFTPAVSGDMGAFDAVHSSRTASPQTTNPMQAVLDALAGTQKSGSLNLDMVYDKADVMYPDMSPQEMVNFSGCDMSGITITQTAIDRQRERSGDPDLCLNFRDANISGCVFKPASTFAGVLIDQTTVSRSTEATNVTFDGLSDHQTDLSLPKGNWSRFAIKGAGEATPANQVNLTVEAGATACCGDITGSRYTKLGAVNADMSGLNASGARGMAVDVVGGRLNGADFSNCSIAPDSRISADLIGANFAGAVLGDLDLSGSRLVGANLEGVDLTNVNLDGAIVRPEDLIGAASKELDETGKPVGEAMTITAADIDQFLQNRKEVGQDIKPQSNETVIKTQVGDKIIQGAGVVDAVKQEVAAIRQSGDRVTPAKQPTQTTQEISTCEVDGLINALCQVNAEMAKGGICRTLGGDEHNVGQQHQTAVHQRDHDLGIERV